MNPVTTSYSNTAEGKTLKAQQEAYEKAVRSAMYANAEENNFDILRAELDNLANSYHVTHSSYTGVDLVCSIQLPNKPPMVFGELYQISYSSFRSKTPVRSLGRVTPKGFTRGSRTITGVMSFSMFDQSIVRKALKEIADQGYHVMMDEMPLFDVTISAANEYGARSKLAILGVTITTEGLAMSVDDVMLSNVFEFQALDLRPFERLDQLNDPLKPIAGFSSVNEGAL